MLPQCPRKLAIVRGNAKVNDLSHVTGLEECHIATLHDIFVS